MKLTIALAAFLAFSSLASAAEERGTVTEVGPNYIELRTEKGEVLRFTVSQKLLDGKPGHKIAYPDRFQSLRVGYDVMLDYRMDRNTMVCEGLHITKRRGGV